MFNQNITLLKSIHCNKRYFSRATRGFRYTKLTRWQRQASGINKWEQQQSHRQGNLARRFFGADTSLTKGTNPEAYKWWGIHRYFLPSMPPEGYEAPTPIGRQAWPAAWTENFALEVTGLSDDELKEFLMEVLTQTIFEETQKDGFELRKLDYEGNPTTELPDRKIIEEFILDEPSLKDRVIGKVLEETLAITPNSEQRKEIRDVPNLIRFVQAFVKRCRPPESAKPPVTEAVQDFIAKQPAQPMFGFVHALPQETRPELLVKWEEQYRQPWQFGHAVYAPRSREQNTRGNVTWMRAQAEAERAEAFQEYVNSGQAKADHMAKIEAASKVVVPSMASE